MRISTILAIGATTLVCRAFDAAPMVQYCVTPYAADVSEGLVARWDFDNNAVDSVHSITGAIAYATQTNGISGGAYYYDGSTSAIDMGSPSYLLLTNAITVTAWVKCAGAGVYAAPVVFCKSPGVGQFTFSLAVGGADRVISAGSWASSFNSAVSQTAAFSLGEWFLVSMTAQRNGPLKIYKNSTEVASGTSGNADYAEAPTMVGKIRGNGFNGIIDELRVYDRVLSPAEITRIYDETKP